VATLLHRLGLFSARRPIAVLLAWFLVMAGAVGGMATLSRPLSNEFEIPDSEFGRVLDELGQEIPQVATARTASPPSRRPPCATPWRRGRTCPTSPR
jgi:hypothetical protein